MPLRSLPPPVGIKQGRNSHTNGNGISNSITNVAADAVGDDFDPDYGLKFTVKVRGESHGCRSCQHTASRIVEYATEYISTPRSCYLTLAVPSMLMMRKRTCKRNSDIPQQLHARDVYPPAVLHWALDKSPLSHPPFVQAPSWQTMRFRRVQVCNI
jgi:hypothetical protein